MDNNSNDQLTLGLILLILGLFVATYSISTFTEIRTLGEKINFEDIDMNNDLSSTEKYYRYIEISDFLNRKLNKNKGILIKNASCVYLDYAQHNTIELYNLTDKRLSGLEAEKQNVAAGNVRMLYNMLDNYKTCAKSVEYKAELGKYLEKIEQKDKDASQYIPEE